MRAKYVFGTTIFAVLLMLPLNAQETPADEPFDVSDLTAELQLAVEVEVSPEGVKIVSSKVLYGTPQEGTAHPDLTVVANSDKISPKTLRIADPRIAFDAPQNYLRGTTVVYLPFDASLRSLSITPTAPREDMSLQRRAYILSRPPFGDARLEEKSVAIDLRPVLRAACTEARDIPECAAVANQ